MKKTLAIVLALVMVLCMIPAMSAAITENKTITDKSYYLSIASKGETKDGKAAWAENKNGNSVTLEYDYENEKPDVTGRWSEDTKMAELLIKGFSEDFTSEATVTIDGKKLTGYSYNATDKQVVMPLEMTKAGYSDTFLIQVTETKDGKTTTETAKISVKMVNTAGYKDSKTAYITNISASDRSIDAYIVGDKIYLDYVWNKGASYTETTEVKFTFANENKAAFTGITYVKDNEVFDLAGVSETKLDKSAASFKVDQSKLPAKEIVFELETKDAWYKTKKYDVVYREGIQETDPKGIYFAETTKTIAVAESYAPVVMGVATGKKVDAEVAYGDRTSKEVIDINDKKTIIGTREGVAYITATYETNNGTKYTATGSMKIIVTAGPSIPPVANTATYYVTCRNLNVRKGPGTSYGKSGMIHRGDAVEVVSIANGWAKMANGKYVSAKYISK